MAVAGPERRRLVEAVSHESEDELVNITVEPATGQRWDDVVGVFAGRVARRAGVSDFAGQAELTSQPRCATRSSVPMHQWA